MCVVYFKQIGQIEQWRNFDFVEPELSRSWAAQPCPGGGYARQGSLHLGDLPRESVSAYVLVWALTATPVPKLSVNVALEMCSK